MEGRINEGGALEIRRIIEWKEQRCCNNYDRFCGDECPHFGDIDNDFELEICHGRKLKFDIFTDDREGGV